MTETSLPSETISNPRLGSSGFQVKLLWDPSVTESMKQPVRVAASIFVTLFTSKALHQVIVMNMSSGLGQSETSLFPLSSYDVLKSSYDASTQGSNPRALAAANNFPPTDPLGGPTYFMTATATQVFHVDTSGTTLEPNQMSINFNEGSTYDLVGTCMHEISEQMGRIGGFSQNGMTFRGILDLCAWKAANTRAVEFDTGGYFSLDAGANVVSLFNTDHNGDPADWSGVTLATDCCNAFATPNVVEPFTVPDLVTMNALGYDLAPVQYVQDTIHLAIGKAVVMTNNYTPILGQSPSSFTISPALPSGLLFSETDGTISGTPNQITAQTLYTVTFTAPGLQVTGGLNLDVVSSSSSGSGLDAGVIVAIVLAAIVFVILVVFLAYQSLESRPAKSKH